MLLAHWREGDNLGRFEVLKLGVIRKVLSVSSNALRYHDDNWKARLALLIRKISSRQWPRRHHSDISHWVRDNSEGSSASVRCGTKYLYYASGLEFQLVVDLRGDNQPLRFPSNTEATVVYCSVLYLYHTFLQILYCIVRTLNLNFPAFVRFVRQAGHHH